jgi:hypothetical protein
VRAKPREQGFFLSADVADFAGEFFIRRFRRFTQILSSFLAAQRQETTTGEDFFVIFFTTKGARGAKFLSADFEGGLPPLRGEQAGGFFYLRIGRIGWIGRAGRFPLAK